MEAVENGPLSEERRQELLKTRRDGLNARRRPERSKPASGGVHRQEARRS